MNDKLKWILGAVALVAVILIGRAWLQEHDARLQAEARSTLDKQKADDAQAIIGSANNAKSQADATLKATLASIAQQRTIVVTPQQAATVANTLPNLPKPVEAKEVPATATAPASQEIVIPKEDIPAFQKYKLDCDANAATLNACQLNTAQDKIIADEGAVKLRAMTDDRDSWKATAKGGTFWHRLKHDAVQIGISAAVGYAAGRLQK